MNYNPDPDNPHLYAVAESQEGVTFTVFDENRTTVAAPVNVATSINTKIITEGTSFSSVLDAGLPKVLFDHANGTTVNIVYNGTTTKLLVIDSAGTLSEEELAIDATAVQSTVRRRAQLQQSAGDPELCVPVSTYVTMMSRIFGNGCTAGSTSPHCISAFQELARVSLDLCGLMPLEDEQIEPIPGDEPLAVLAVAQLCGVPEQAPVAGEPIQLAASAQGGSGNYSYRWVVDGPLGPGVPEIDPIKNPHATFPQAGQYRVFVIVRDDETLLQIPADEPCVIDVKNSHMLTATAQGNGRVEPSGGSFVEGTVVSLTATPDTGYVFDHWEGDASGSAAAIQITMTSRKNVIAVFVPQYVLTVKTSPIGGGSAVWEPNRSAYKEGTQVTLNAVPTNGWFFDHWESNVALGDAYGSPLSVIMDTGKTITAVFRDYTCNVAFCRQVDWYSDPNGVPYGGLPGVDTITIDCIHGPDGATVSNQADGEYTVTGRYTLGTFDAATISLEWGGDTTYGYTKPFSIPAKGSGFFSVSLEKISGGAGNMFLLMSIGNTWICTSVPVNELCSTDGQSVLTAEVQGHGTIDPPYGAYDKGTQVTLTATPADGWCFDRWEGDLTGAQNPAKITMDRDKAVAAVFLRSIVPGRSVGPVALGETFGTVTTYLGSPTYLTPSPDYWSVLFLYEEPGIGGYVTDIDMDEEADPYEPVEMVSATTLSAGVYQGAGVGSSLDVVLQVMGPAEEIDGNTYWYWTRGIAWDVSLNAVTMVTVFDPIGTNNSRTAMSTSGGSKYMKQLVRGLHFRHTGARPEEGSPKSRPQGS